MVDLNFSHGGMRGIVQMVLRYSPTLLHSLYDSPTVIHSSTPSLLSLTVYTYTRTLLATISQRGLAVRHLFKCVIAAGGHVVTVYTCICLYVYMSFLHVVYVYAYAYTVYCLFFLCVYVCVYVVYAYVLCVYTVMFYTSQRGL